MLSHRVRFIIFLFFFVVFFIAAPTIILYTAGYRYNFGKQKMEKSGLLFIEAQPTNIQIYLNGRLTPAQTQGTGWRVTDLLPTEYQLKITSDGYLPWEQTVRVTSGETTFIKDIFLLQSEQSPETVIDNITYAANSPDKSLFFLIQENHQVIVFDSLKEKIKYNINLETTITPDEITNVLWATDAQKIILSDNTNHKVINLKTGQIIYTLPKKFKVKWGEDSDTILAFTSDQIQQINLSTAQTTAIALNSLPQIIDLTTTKSYLYILGETNKERQILKYSRNGADNLEINANTVSWSTNQTLNFFNNYLLLATDNGDETTIINQIDLTSVFTLSGKNLQHSEALGGTVYYNAFEIWRADLATQKTNLVDRYSRPILSLIPHPKFPSIIFTDGKEIKITEINNQNTVFSQTITSAENISNLAINKKGDEVYFIAASNGEKSLWRIAIH